MKFYQFLCLFVKNSPLFSESLEKGLDKVVSRGEKNFSVHNQYMNFLRPRKTALDECLYKLSAGRSMVEMLGVLAIIGVLSVGAIAGYSKAMLKYKLNRQTEQIGSILDYISIYNDQLSGNQVTNINSILRKLGAIPTEMIKPDDASYVYDVFGSRIHFFYGNESNGAQYYTMAVIMDKYSHEICMNLYQMAKLRSANLWQTSFIKDQESGENAQGNRVFGDVYCSSSSKCLKDLTLSEMDELCNFCDDANSTCRFNILWDYKKG